MSQSKPLHTVWGERSMGGPSKSDWATRPPGASCSEDGIAFQG